MLKTKVRGEGVQVTVMVRETSGPGPGQKKTWSRSRPGGTEIGIGTTLPISRIFANSESPN